MSLDSPSGSMACRPWTSARPLAGDPQMTVGAAEEHLKAAAGVCRHCRVSGRGAAQADRDGLR